MFEKALILGLYSVTPVHAGSGAELSVIDLPIQRERHTGFPIIWGQSLKGVLRRAYADFERKQLKEQIEKETDSNKKKELEKALDELPKTNVIFGPPTDRAHEHAGSISVGDAKILLFPVRSLKGVFAYVTCPMVLERLKRDLELVGKNLDFDISLSESKAVVSENSSIIVDGNVVIEDIVLSAEEKDLSNLMKTIKAISPIEIDEGRVAIVHDNVFSSLVQMATEIVARIKISSETGTVETGALWYEEYLPSDTLLYSVIAIGKPRRDIDKLSTADDIVRELKVFNGRFIQVGGNETVGKGFVKLRVTEYENA